MEARCCAGSVDEGFPGEKECVSVKVISVEIIERIANEKSKIWIRGNE